MTRTTTWLALVWLTAAVGCKFPSVQEYEIKWRNQFWAKKAWRQVEPMYRASGAKKPILDDFGRGFRDGYFAVAMGSDGTIPLFPPTLYWGTKHQNPTGRDEIAAWFAGYQEGVTAADKDGVGYWMQIPMSGGEETAIAEAEDRRKRRFGKPEDVPAGPPIETVPVPIEELPPTPTMPGPALSPAPREVLLRLPETNE
ncbi:MAG TPA: hypothetical protein VHZ24_01270 [Pirellulales bacterium]|jgi:hypothetical protein|nr:hypothetical protein [Pirellulales bacterium]